MNSRLPAASASIALMLLLVSPAGAQELNARELKKVVKQADRAYGAGSYGEAAALYDQILASTSGSDARRGDALYASAMIRLSGEGGQRDEAAARRQLDELSASFPRHPRRLEVAFARSLLGALDKARAEVRRHVAELAEKTAAFEAERRQTEAERQEAAGESQAAGGRVRSLEAGLAKLRAEAAECQAELEKKESALQKLRDALVGGSG